MQKSLNACRTRKNDVLYTPKELALRCIQLVDIQPGDVLYDPFRGKGVFFDNFPCGNVKVYAEIAGISRD